MANKDYSFSVMPTVSISRSKFNRKSQHKTSFNLGYIVPIYLDEVLPGDTRTLNMSSLIRMSTPIAPIMDNVYLDTYAFFVPNRLLWVHWKEFMGENNSSAGIPLISYALPQITVDDVNSVGTVSDYFGLPRKTANNYSVSALPFRAYGLIYNRWFRNQNLIAPLAVQTSDTNGAIVGSSNASGLTLQKASKLPDYFTTGLPFAQKGVPVSIPLGSSAPIYGLYDKTLVSTGTMYLGASVSDNNGRIFNANGTAISDLTSDNWSLMNNSYGRLSGIRMFADLSNATAATINQLRYAFQLQKLLEKDALYGTRYWEILAAHFGVTSPDASLQDPEYLGGQRIHINVDQVLSTAGYQAGNTTTVGAPGANSVTGSSGSLFTKSFTEHGFIIVVAVARHDQTYSQGINRMWSRSSRYSFYFPVMANLGAQDVLNKEIYAVGSASQDNAVFSYQEAWAEYRYKPSICTALLNPVATGSLDYWTLANKFAALPTLGQTFIEQDRTALARALVTGATGPDFIGDFYFIDEAVRPMPMYSIPGLIDHH